VNELSYLYGSERYEACEDEGGAGQISVEDAAENGAPSCVQKRRFQTGNKGGG